VSELGQEIHSPGEVTEVGSERALIEGVDEGGVVGVERRFRWGVHPPLQDAISQNEM
jgi:hypothetical protein